MNTWPGGKRKALSQTEHAKWNANNYPGTRQICTNCGEPTELCEEDGFFNDKGEPFCDNICMQAFTEPNN